MNDLRHNLNMLWNYNKVEKYFDFLSLYNFFKDFSLKMFSVNFIVNNKLILIQPLGE